MSPRAAPKPALTDEQYAELLAAQGGGCAICGATPKTRRLAIDHDHKTGKLRGLLCHRCNRALPAWVTTGWLDDASDYLCGRTKLRPSRRMMTAHEGTQSWPGA